MFKGSIESRKVPMTQLSSQNKFEGLSGPFPFLLLGFFYRLGAIQLKIVFFSLIMVRGYTILFIFWVIIFVESQVEGYRGKKKVYLFIFYLLI